MSLAFQWAIFKGLIIPGYILLSDKHQRGNVTKTNEGALCSEGVWSHFREGFVRQQYMARND